MGMLEVKDTDTLIEGITDILKDYQDIVLFSANYPADHIRFAANHLWRKPGQKMDYEGEELSLYPIHSIEGSFGAEIHPSFLKTNKDFKEIRRGTNSKTNPSQLWEQEEELTKALGLPQQTELHLCGIETDPKVWEKSITFLEQKGYTTKRIEKLIRSEVLPFDY